MMGGPLACDRLLLAVWFNFAQNALKKCKNLLQSGVLG